MKQLPILGNTLPIYQPKVWDINCQPLEKFASFLLGLGKSKDMLEKRAC